MSEHSHDVQVAILAGGLGTRLRDVAAHRAKPLVDVGGRPFLRWNLDRLRDQGFCDVVLCIGYRANDYHTLLGDGSRLGLRLTYSREQSPLGTAGALRLAEPLVHASYVIVQNGDTYCNFDLRAVVEEHRRSGAAATMVVTKVQDVSQFGSVEFAQNMSITRFREKAASAGEGFINAGTYVMNRNQIGRIAPSQPLSLETDIFPEMCGQHFRAFPVNGTFIDIGTPESLVRARAFFAHRANGHTPGQQGRSSIRSTVATTENRAGR